MADNKAPDPTIGTEGTDGKESESSVAKDLLGELDKLGIGSKEELSNMATASSQSGNLARMLGEIRNENAELRKQLQGMAKPQQQYSEYDNLYDQPEERPATMREIRGMLRDMQEAGTKAQQIAWAEYADIQNDKDYAVFEKEFQKQLQNPQTQSMLNTGQTTLRTVYNETVKNGLMNALLTMRGKLEQIDGQTVGKTQPPHIESGTHTDANVQNLDRSDEEDRIEKVLKNRRGNDDDVRGLLDALLPDGEITKMRMRS